MGFRSRRSTWTKRGRQAADPGRPLQTGLQLDCRLRRALRTLFFRPRVDLVGDIEPARLTTQVGLETGRAGIQCWDRGTRSDSLAVRWHTPGVSAPSQTRKVETRDGTVLHGELWMPEGEPRFVVCISHGQAEHVSRYDQVAAELNAIGGIVFGCDHRGQGRSGGTPAHIDRFEQYSEDLLEVILDFQAHLGEGCDAKSLPWFLWGHSMGGLIALTYLLDHERDFDFKGVIVSAPLIGLVLKIGPVKQALVRFAAKVVPRMKVPSGLPPETISRDPAQVKAYVEDTRRIAPITPGWAVAMEAAAERVRRGVAQIHTPMHWYAGSGDLICDHDVTREVFTSMPAAEARGHSFQSWPGYYHELHNEPEALRKPVIESVHAWIESRIEAQNPDQNPDQDPNQDKTGQ